MMAVSTPAPSETRAETPERKCIVSGEMRSKDALIRFVLSPDGVIVPDIAGSLPGRGLWVSADRASIETAARKNLFSKAAKENAKADPDMADLVARLIRQRCLQLLGLARGAGIAVLGQPQVEAAMKARKIALALVAADAGSGAEKIVAEDVTRLFTRQELGAALGYEQIVYAGLAPHGLTDKLVFELARLEKIASAHHINSEQEREQKTHE